MRIEVTPVTVSTDARHYLDQVLDSGALVQGRIVDMLERTFCAMSGAAHCIATSSGTSALQLALEAARVGPGDEVITSPFTFAATLNAILSRGAIARLVDIDPKTFNARPDLAESAINPATKALMPVHLYGLAADMQAFCQMARRYRLRLVEDAAQAHLATAKGYSVGTLDLGCFSLYATKNLMAGEGGLVTASRTSDAAFLRVLRNQGMQDRYDYVAVGYNYRLTDLAAALAVGQLTRLRQATDQRRKNANFLTQALHGLPGIVLPAAPEGYEHVWHQYTIRVTAEAPLSRDDLAHHLAVAGIGTAVYYPKTLVDYPVFRDHPHVRWDGVEEARAAAREVLALPVHPYLSQSDLDELASTIRAVMGVR